jgi:hypothetical protein
LQDERHRDLGFRVEHLKFSSTLVALTFVRKPQTHLTNPSHVEEENEFVDDEFQHGKDIEDASQCFKDWNSPPTYDSYVDN